MSINRFLQYTLKHSILIIILTLGTTLVMGYHAFKVQINPDTSSLTPVNNQRTSHLKESIGLESESTNFVFLSVRSDDLYTLETMNHLARVIEDVSQMEEVSSVLSPFNFIYFDTQGRRIIPSTISPSGKAPANEKELALFSTRISKAPLAKNFVIAEEGRMLNIIFTTEYSPDPSAFMSRFEQIVAPLEENVEVYYSGEIPIGSRITHYLDRDFLTLLALALVAMLTIFFLSFRSKRAVILPIAVVGIGAVWSVGFMALVNYKLTIVSVIIPSLILTIGSSYTIHVLNEYYRNIDGSREDNRQALADAVEHVTRTVILAGLTTIISFASLMTTSMIPLREFGLSISLGIFFCALLSLFFLPAVFNLLGPPQEHHKKRVNRGRLTKWVTLLGLWAAKHRRLSILFFMILGVLFLLFYPHIRHQSDYFSYFPEDDRIIRDTRTIIKNSGGSQSFNLTLTVPDEKKGYFLEPENLKKVERIEQALMDHDVVNSSLSFNGVLKSMNRAVTGQETIPESRGLILLLNRYFRMIPTDRYSLGEPGALMNPDATSMTVYLRISNPETHSYVDEEDMKRFLDEASVLLDRETGTQINADLWGNTLLLLDTSDTIRRDQVISTLLSMALGLIVTFLFFRSFTYSLMALIPLISGICFYFISLYLFRIPLDMTTILVTNVTVGVGLDDAVHFILQYRKQRKSCGYERALRETLRITGRPIVLTTLSLMAGLLVLCFASFSPIIYFGILIAGTLGSTMMGTVFFLPAVIALYENGRSVLNRQEG